MTTHPAGWYPDPDDADTKRYWDGSQWLDIPPPTKPLATAEVDDSPIHPDQHPEPSPHAYVEQPPYTYVEQPPYTYPEQSPPQDDSTKSSKKRNRRLLGLAIAVIGLLALGGTAWKITTDQQVAAAKAATEQLQLEEEQRAEEAEQDRIAEEQAADDLEREVRELTVTDIEAAIKTMAEEHIAAGIMDGPVISVDCSAVGGGATDDLDQSTTVFDCFVAVTDNGDGTLSGYPYHATMNWDTGSYTYGRGAP